MPGPGRPPAVHRCVVHYSRSVRNFTVTDDVRDYAVGHGSWPPNEVIHELRSTTQALGDVANMQIGDDQGQLLTIMTRLVGARRAVEVGTFTGYSSLCIARGLVSGGSLLCCDVSEDWTAIALRAWERAGLSDRIELRIGPALQTLRALPLEADLDLAFIDADKPAYDAYYEACLRLVRPGGLIALDNMLWHGSVADANDHEATTEILRALSLKIRDDPRVESCLVTIGDGMMLAVRR